MAGPQKLTESLLLPINPAAVIILGVYTTLWGLWIFSPFWTVFTQASLYRVMLSISPGRLFDSLALISPEIFWGSIAIVCGILITYGAVVRVYGPLVRGARVGAWHWLVIAIMYFLGDPLNTGGITSLMLCVYSVFIYLNLRVNFKNNKDEMHLLEADSED